MRSWLLVSTGRLCEDLIAWNGYGTGSTLFVVCVVIIFFKQTILESLVLIKNLMRLIKESQTQNYERPQIIEIDLIPQGVLCDSLDGSASGSDSDPAGTPWGGSENE